MEIKIKEVIGKLNSMYLVVEYEEHCIKHHLRRTGRKIITNKSHRNYNEMWEWTRKEIKKWYEENGDHWENEKEKWSSKDKDKAR